MKRNSINIIIYGKPCDGGMKLLFHSRDKDRVCLLGGREYRFVGFIATIAELGTKHNAPFTWKKMENYVYNS